MDITDPIEGELLLEQPVTSARKTSLSIQNGDLATTSLGHPDHCPSENGKEVGSEADRVTPSEEEAGEQSSTAKEEDRHESVLPPTAIVDTTDESIESKSSGVMVDHLQNSMDVPAANPGVGEVKSTSSLSEEGGLSAVEGEIIHPVSSSQDMSSDDKSALMEEVPQEDEVGKTCGAEGQLVDKNKDDAKKSKPKETKKSKKGRDSEYMGRTLSQALAGLNTPEEKIAALCKKYAELLGEHKVLQRDHKTQQKQLVMLQRDRDQLQSEHGRAILAKSKLESLCRELQRHNKTIKEESIQRSKEEDEKRKEVSNKFQQTINEITNQMQDNHTRNIRLKEENLELASKLKKLVEQYERREEHIDKIFKHKELETQLSDAKLQQSNLALQEEQERNKRQKAILLNEAAEAQTKCELLMKQETQLKAQLAVYTEKFEEFQTTLTKSNEIFQTFKQEMDQMTKKIKKLEKETNMWRVRWENSNKSLLNMAEERTIREKELASLKNKLMRLENLCRALQAERNALLEKARSKEGKLKSPSKSKELIESVCVTTKAETPPTTSCPEAEHSGPVIPNESQMETGQTGPDISEKTSEPTSPVDDKVLTNGECSHGVALEEVVNGSDRQGSEIAEGLNGDDHQDGEDIQEESSLGRTGEIGGQSEGSTHIDTSHSVQGVSDDQGSGPQPSGTGGGDGEVNIEGAVICPPSIEDGSEGSTTAAAATDHDSEVVQTEQCE